MLSLVSFQKISRSVIFKGDGLGPLLFQTCNISHLRLPPQYGRVEMPADRKPKSAPAIPTLPNNNKPAKMPRMINLMRWPERVHNTLIHKQYGMQVIRGGRLHAHHFETIVKKMNEKLDFKRQFFVWRVDSPWQSCTKRPIGFTLGGGKGNIHHYVTPVAPDRIIFEIGGDCSYSEVKDLITYMCEKVVPFRARAVCHEEMLQEKQQEKVDAEHNMNPYTWEYLIKNNMLGCRKYVKRIDYEFFGKYL